MGNCPRGFESHPVRSISSSGLQGHRLPQTAPKHFWRSETQEFLGEYHQKTPRRIDEAVNSLYSDPLKDHQDYDNVGRDGDTDNSKATGKR